jgi:hypothetical protein
MITDACNFQRRQLNDTMESHVASLIRGTGSRDDDQRVRGIIYGLQLAISVVNDLEDRARRAEQSDE